MQVRSVHEGRLSLRLVKVFEETEPTPELLATMRQGEYLKPRFERVEDAEIVASSGAIDSRSELGQESVPSERNEEDPYAWAAAWADEEEDSVEEEEADDDSPDFDETYFEDKYELD
ncbi:MAG: hypothetical protein SGPRY_014392, partial [Prymnesium sp.]